MKSNAFRAKHMKIMSAVVNEAFSWGRTIRRYTVKVEAPSTLAAAIWESGIDLIPAKKMIPEYPANCHINAAMMQYMTIFGSVIHLLLRNPNPSISSKTFIVPTFGLYIQAHKAAVTTNEREKGNK
jgi:hypothetical protein